MKKKPKTSHPRHAEFISASHETGILKQVQDDVRKQVQHDIGRKRKKKNLIINN